MKDIVKVSYNIDKKLKSKLVIVAENRGLNQKELIIEYMKNGLNKDKKYLSIHLDK